MHSVTNLLIASSLLTPGSAILPANRQKGNISLRVDGLVMALRMEEKCISRESNPGHIDGNDVFYH